MKMVTAVWLAGILCLTSAVFSKAGSNDLVDAAIDSSEAMQAQDLEDAKNLSGKFIDGFVGFQANTPVHVQACSGGAGISKTEKLLIFTVPKEMSLSSKVPPPARLLINGETQKIEARIRAIDEVLLAGLLTESLANALIAERERLIKILLAGSSDGTAGLISGPLVEKIKQRIQQINQTFLAGYIFPELVAKLKAERAALIKILLAGLSSSDSTAGMFINGETQKIEARIRAIYEVLLYGLLTESLAKELNTERERLIKILLAGSSDGTAGLISGPLVEKIKQRIQQIDQAILAGMLTNNLAARLKVERAALIKILLQA